MPKLSATSGLDPEAITRVDITTEMIKNMSDAELEDMLRKLRGNREVVAAKAANKSSTPRTPKGPKMTPDDDEDEKVSI